MKIIKRLLVGVLMLALFVSCFAMASFADASENYAAILEYYTQPTFVVEDFDDLAVGKYVGGKDGNGTDIVLNAASDQTQQFMEVVSEGDNKYLRWNTADQVVKSKLRGNMGMRWNGKKYATGFIADFAISGTSNGAVMTECTNKCADVSYASADLVPATCPVCGQEGTLSVTPSTHPIVRLYVGDVVSTDNANALRVGTEFITLDFQAGTVSYYTAEGMKAVENFTISPATWYKVSIRYDGNTKTYSLTVTDAKDATKTATVTDAAGPFNIIQHLRLTTLNSDKNRSQVVCIDDLSIIGGTFVRDDSQAQAETEKALIRFAGICEDANASIDDKQAVIEVYSDLVNKHDFTSDKAEVNTALSKLQVYSITVYANELKACVDGIDYDGGYTVRLNNLNRYSRYLNKIPEDLSVLDDTTKAEVQKVIADFNTEVAAVEKLKTDSETYIAAVNAADYNTDDYTVLTAYAAEFDAMTPDPTYTGVAEAAAIHQIIVDKAATIKTAADEFISNVNVMKTSETFIDKYNAYIGATDAMYTNETYEGITQALADYAEYSAPIVEVETICNNYILAVDRAYYATYLSAKESNLDAADTYLEGLEDTFPGVAEAKATYTELRQLIATKKQDADAYIAAVAALEGKTGAELRAAIDAAQALKEAGNIAGFEGVTDANIALSNAIASIELVVAQSRQFVTLVGRIAEAKTVDAKLAAILAAMGAEDNAVETETGVTAAKSTLAAAIADYNAQVTAVNDAFAEVNGSAADLSVSVVGNNGATTMVAKVVALIKKIFD